MYPSHRIRYRHVSLTLHVYALMTVSSAPLFQWFTLTVSR
jgi:hypothetical protein